VIGTSYWGDLHDMLAGPAPSTGICDRWRRVEDISFEDGGHHEVVCKVYYMFLRIGFFLRKHST